MKTMETMRVLNLLNKKAASELRDGLLEEARDSATQAVNYFVATNSKNRSAGSDAAQPLLSQARVSALLLRRIGLKYRELGEERNDDDLLNAAKRLADQSLLTLRLSNTVDERHALSTLQKPVSKRVCAKRETT